MNIPADIALIDEDRAPLAAWRGAASFSSGPHGDEACTVSAPATRYPTLELYSRLSARMTLRVTVGGGRVWEGRVEDITAGDAGPSVQAFGRWRALMDVPYTALWSDTKLERWRVMTATDRASRAPDRFGFDQNNRLLIYPKTGQSYASNRIGSFVYEPPSQASRTIAGVMCTIQHLLPNATWLVQIGTIAGTLAGGALTVQAAVNGTGALVTTTFFLTFAAQDFLIINLLYNGALAAYPNTDGDNYVIVTDLRVVGITTPLVGGNLGTAVGAPGAVAVTPTAGMAGIYVGQKIRVAGTISEIVTVSSITSTTFTATFAQTHLSTDPIRAFLVYGDAIARDCRDQANVANPGALSASNALINSPGLDLLDEVYEDADMAQVLTRLAGLGDSAGGRYEVGVDGDLLCFRSRGSAGQTWYVDAADLQLQQTLDQLVNSTYGRYQRADGFTLRTAAAADTASVNRYGLTRRRAIDADTTNATLAATIAQTARDDGSDPPPRARLSVRAIYTASGVPAPLTLVRAGDTLVIRNLTPVAGPTVDRIRSFRLDQAVMDLAAGALSVVPETPLPELEYLLARRETFGPRAAGRLQ